MSAEGSVTRWIAQLELSDADRAQEELWKRYFDQLVRLARTKLGNAPRRVADEEDVAVVALQSFFGGAREGRFPQLRDRSGLWPLLAKITSHKAIDQRRRWLAQKQGGGRAPIEMNDGIGEGPDNGWPAGLLEDELRPDFIVAINEECQRLMDQLPDDSMREITRLRLEGYTNAEIAEALGVVKRTVERKVGLIRDHWLTQMEND